MPHEEVMDNPIITMRMGRNASLRLWPFEAKPFNPGKILVTRFNGLFSSDSTEFVRTELRV